MRVCTQQILYYYIMSEIMKFNHLLAIANSWIFVNAVIRVFLTINYLKQE